MNGRNRKIREEGGRALEEGSRGGGCAEENARLRVRVRGGDGVALSAPALTPLGLGVISTLLSILLPPPPLGSGVPVATRGASLPTSGALPGLTGRMHCPLAQWGNGCPDTEPRDPALQLCSRGRRLRLRDRLRDHCADFSSPSSRLSSPSHVSRTFGPDSSSER